MARCSHCVEIVPFDAWWCPSCSQRTDDAPRGAARRRPPGALEAGGDGSTAGDRRFAELDPVWRDAYRAACRRRRRRRRGVVVASLLAGCLLVAGLAVWALPSPGGPITVPLYFGQGNGPYGPDANSPPAIDVTVGDNAPIPVVLDTGSVGLRVFTGEIDTAAADGVHVGSATDQVAFADGSVWSGRVATARLGIGGLTTAGPVPFELVEKVGCEPGRAGCPSAGGLAAVEGYSAFGVLGVGLGGPAAGDPALNPLTALPGVYGRIWTIDLAQYGGSNEVAGTLTLGDGPPVAGSSVVLHLAPLGSASGVPLWDDQPTLCWTIGRQRTCQPTVFDSGADYVVVGSADYGGPTTSLGSGEPDIVEQVEPVSLSLPGSATAFYSFDSGASPGTSAVAVQPGRVPVLNSGCQAFFDLVFRYDVTAGTITVVNPPA